MRGKKWRESTDARVDASKGVQGNQRGRRVEKEIVYVSSGSEEWGSDQEMTLRERVLRMMKKRS
jgi:hypothetical protein